MSHFEVFVSLLAAEGVIRLAALAWDRFVAQPRRAERLLWRRSGGPGAPPR